MKNKEKIIIGNWKMNPETLEEAKEIAISLKKKVKNYKKTKVVICPPSIYLNDLNKTLNKSNIKLGVQNTFWENKGSFTGQISPSMIKNLKNQFVILGHSELRELGENDEIVNKKILSALKNKLKVILCIGEVERDKDGKYLSNLKEQINTCLLKVKKSELSNLYIAYEPIWAIGKEKAITGRDLHQSSLFIRKVISEIYDQSSAMSIKIIYGGSVKPENTQDLITEGDIEGFLVGRESLNPKNFSEIIKITSEN